MSRPRRSGRPKRSLGQNFLVDRSIAARIVEETRVEPGDSLLEIGPGRGALTEGLARKVVEADGRLLLVELDDRMAEELQRRFEGNSRVRVIHGDILEIQLADLVEAPGSLKVVGNIPYNVTSPILFHLLTPPRPREILLMVQREVADRILASPGTGEFGALTVGVRTAGHVERVLNVAPGAFRPRPRVDSTVVRFTPFDPPRLGPEEEARLRRLSRSLFQWRRKQLGKILRDHPELGLAPDEVRKVARAAGVESTARPETISPEGFVAMAEALPSEGGEGGAPD